MFFFAQYLIYILIFLVLWVGIVILPAPNFKDMIKLLMTALAFDVTISWLLATIWGHKRPVVELAEIKELLKPMQVWKSFPSDHTSISFIFALIGILSGCGLVWGIVFVVMASLIAFSEFMLDSYHEICGWKLIFAFVFVFLSFELLENVQPCIIFL
jgi:membrane-associated phospholipid phosphatase